MHDAAQAAWAERRLAAHWSGHAAGRGPARYAGPTAAAFPEDSRAWRVGNPAHSATHVAGDLKRTRGATAPDEDQIRENAGGEVVAQ
eukprot:3574447-Alexandrium_andersonii.AAC.1